MFRLRRWAGRGFGRWGAYFSVFSVQYSVIKRGQFSAARGLSHPGVNRPFAGQQKFRNLTKANKGNEERRTTDDADERGFSEDSDFGTGGNGANRGMTRIARIFTSGIGSKPAKHAKHTK